jgi:hypothetical protein
MTEILTPCCPLCGEAPMMVFGGGSQAFCGNDDCVLLNWTPTLSLDSNLLHAGVVKLPPASDEREKN